MKQILETFYSAFQNLDAETMVSCYHDEIIFEDPAFGKLKGEQAKNMWRMLCESQKDGDFTVYFSDVEFTDKVGKANWEAIYYFGKNKRQVHNRIHAKFEFNEGKIVKHTDEFNLYKWSRQALGIKGTFFGWTKFFKLGLNKKTGRLLSQFEGKTKKP